jgi:hypothetical protein
MATEMDCSLIKGGWGIGLSNGRLVDLLDMKDEDLLNIEVIANSLALQCRYMGHTNRHYSVAAHSRYVCDAIVAQYGICRAAFAGLIHDFSEAFCHDLVRGVKVGLKNEGSRYQEIEHRIQTRIYELAGLDDHEKYHAIVKEYDNRILRMEIDEFIPDACPEWRAMIDGIPPVPGIKVGYVTPGAARVELTVRFNCYRNLLLKGQLTR